MLTAVMEYGGDYYRRNNQERALDKFKVVGGMEIGGKRKRRDEAQRFLFDTLSFV